MRIYITGATGYLGTNLVNALIMDEMVKELRLLVKSKKRKDLFLQQIRGFKNIPVENKKLEKITFQFGSLPHVDLNLGDIDCVIHSAALRGPEACRNNVKKAIDINIFGTKKLVTDIKRYNCKKTIFISSQSVYLNNPDVPWKETSEAAPAEIYSATKYAGELLITELEKDGLLYAILRPSRLYGLGFNMRENELLVKFAHSIVNNSPLTINKKAKGKMDILHINDMVNFIIKVINTKNKGVWNQTFNVGSGVHVSILEIVQYFERLAEELAISPVEKEYINSVLNKNDLWLDISKAKRFLNWKPKVLLEDGIKEIILHELNKS